MQEVTLTIGDYLYAFYQKAGIQAGVARSME